MSKFLTGKDLEEKLTDIIWNAKKYVIIVSPFIKLDDYVKNIFEKVKSRHDISFYLLFGKNESSRNRSISKKDFEYFTEFKNISILYNKDLHAKHYCNENEGLITSLNLYDYSMINNVEYGVHFTTSLIGSDKLFLETEKFTDDLLFNKSDVIFLKKPQYSSSLFGFKKNYQDSNILFDISEDFFENKESYDKQILINFDIDTETSVEKKFNIKPTRENLKDKTVEIKEVITPTKSKALFFEKNEESESDNGFCIRTGTEIPFDPDRPYSYRAYKSWAQFENYNYSENYCHKTGEESYGKTNMNNPILKK